MKNKLHTTTLLELPLGTWTTVQRVEGERGFRRRLLELGFVPGTRVRALSTAPLGDPLKLELRSCHVSLRRAEVAGIEVAP